MKLLPRFIRTRRLRWPFWTSAGIAMLLVSAFAASAWGSLWASRRGPVTHIFEVKSGCIVYWRTAIAADTYVNWTPETRGAYWRGKPHLQWFPEWKNKGVSWGSMQTTKTAIPLYLLALPFVLFSTISFIRAPLKYGEGHCKHCGYDMRGIREEMCPECGKGAP